MALLEAEGVTKSYAGIHALKNGSLSVLPGEIHALVGENGAGKSTLIRIITGATQADSGTVKIEGKTLSPNSPAIARAHGISAIYQQPALLPDLSVTENIALGMERGSVWRRVNWRLRRELAAKLLADTGASIDPDAPVRTLSMPEQQMVEIARSIGAQAKVLILDEPTASLSSREVDALFRLLRRLREQGVGIVYISHRLEELPEIASRVTVLRDGSTIATHDMAEVDRAMLIRLMVGRELSAVFPKREVPHGEVLMEVENLSSRAAGVRNVSFSLRAGEILGLAGLVGSGRTELAEALFGLRPLDSGRVLLRGNAVTIRTPAEAIALGLAYVPEDRPRHGLIPPMSIAANTTLARLQRVSRAGWMDFGREAELSARLVMQLGTKTPSVHLPVSSLSGGNQQKVLLARWLAANPSVLILDEPTQGVDVGAKSEIHKLIVDLAEQGLAILMISSELPEILGMSDRIAVMRGGAIVATMDRADATQQKILALALSETHVP